MPQPCHHCRVVFHADHLQPNEIVANRLVCADCDEELWDELTFECHIETRPGCVCQPCLRHRYRCEREANALMEQSGEWPVIQAADGEVGF